MTEILENNETIEIKSEDEGVEELKDVVILEPTAHEPIEETENQACTILEGLLFIVGDEGITIEQASDVTGMSIEKTEESFSKLQLMYSDDNRGIEVVNYGGSYKFLSKGIIHPYAEKLFQNTKHIALSQSALETLAIIAYKQPITRVEIEEIRGVGCDMMLRKLQARNLIQENGRSDAPGRPILYEVTTEFMDSFKLYSLDELPSLPEFSSENESEDLFQQ